MTRTKQQLILAALVFSAAACQGGAADDRRAPRGAAAPNLPGVHPEARPRSLEPERFADPSGVFTYARAHERDAGNREAAVPPMCYTRTDGISNPCWVCHTEGRGRTMLDDSDLQASYDFSETALQNHWTNFFKPPRLSDSAPGPAPASAPALPSPFLDDAVLLAYIRGDNYTPLRAALAALPAGYAGFRPDLDLTAEGFDELGFARNGSGWRALRYVPFPGAFWPSNGAASDAFVRLPDSLRRDAAGAPSLPIYRLNLAITEAAMTADDRGDGALAIDREVEPVDERLLGNGLEADLDGDGALGTITRIRRLPARYAGGGKDVAVVAFALPRGTELVHTLRYLDPAEPTSASRRLKELRYMRKVELPDQWGIGQVYAEEADEKDEGLPPRYQGDAEVGLLGGFGWQLQAFIEDERGALRAQSHEEHRTCMGCHGPLGVTVDQTFSFARKLPGLAGWRPQDLRGQLDRPQLGHRRGELRTYLERVGGGDELRANEELLARFFAPAGAPPQAGSAAAAGRAQPRVAAPARLRLRTAELDRARPQTPPARRLDLAALLTPSPGRALALNRAYLAIVRDQAFTRGRAPLLGPAANVHATIDPAAPSTGLLEAQRTYRDGRLLLDWSASGR